MVSTSTVSREKEGSASAVTRAQAVWLLAVQVAALALLVLALFWAGAESDSANRYIPPLSLHAGQQLLQPLKLLLLLLAAGHLIVAVIPALRRGPVSGIWGGITLATACWLTARVTFLVVDKDGFCNPTEPIVAAIVPPAAVALAIWGMIARARLIDASRLGAAALAGGLLLAFFSVGFYLLITYSPAFRNLYSIEIHQLDIMLASIALYSSALWLGSAGLRPEGGWRVQPLGMALIAGIFFACWR